MPFPDEAFSAHVDVVPHREVWAAEGAHLAEELRLLLPEATGVDHIGSTSVPGLAAKDCLDLMVQVHALSDTTQQILTSHGYRRRPESWNQRESTLGVGFEKQVFAPAVGARSCNVHIRIAGGLNVRYALLFRDYLRADDDVADAWGRFKVRLAENVDDLADYGQIKAPAQEIMMRSAEQWAATTGWRLPTP